MSTTLSGDEKYGAVPQASVAPTLPMLLVVATLMPGELNIRISNLLLTMPRLVLLVAMPLALVRGVQQMSRPGFRSSLSDRIIPLAAFWMFLAITMTAGLDRAVVSCGVLILEFAGAYYTARFLCATPGDTPALARVIAFTIAVAALLGPLDTITGRHITHEISSLLTGSVNFTRLDYRNGLLRAQGAQEHPILFGTVCSFGTVLAMVALRGGQRTLVLCCCIIGLLSAVSSAPIMGLLLSCALLIYRRLTPNFDKRWKLIGSTFGVLITAIILFHPRPFGFFFDHFTLEPESGFFRLLTWQVAGPQVLDNPMFGIGLDDWERESWMPGTVDSVWLRLGMEFGIVGAVLIALVTIGACSHRVDTIRRTNLNADEKLLGLGLSLIAFMYVFIGFTVHFWGCTWILMGLFAGMRAQLGSFAAAPLPAEQVERAPP